MGTGQDFVKWIKPAGCVAFFVMFVLATVFLFTSKGTPVEGYEPPEDREYYREHPEELLEEVEDGILPKIDAAGVELELSGGVIQVTGPKKQLHNVRMAVIRYFDEELFEFTEVTA